MNTSTIHEAKDIAQRLDLAATRLCAAIAANNDAQAILREAKDALAGAEATAIFEEGMNPNGKFKGIATTSKMYGYALEAFLAEAKSNGSSLRAKALTVIDATRVANDAATEFEQAKTMFDALKHLAELKGQILAAGG